MNFRIYIINWIAIIVLFIGSLYVVLNSKIVNKETTAIHNDNKYKINAKRGAYVATKEFNIIERDTLNETKRQRRKRLKNKY